MQEIKYKVDLYNPKYLPYLTIISPFLAGLGYFHNLKAIKKTKQAFLTLFGSLFFTLPVIYFIISLNLPYFNDLYKIDVNSLDFEILYFCFRFILPFIIADLISRSFSPYELKKIGISDQTYSKSIFGLFGWFILILIIFSIFFIVLFFNLILNMLL